MSKKLEIRLSPLEPFFFGNDRTFFYGEDDIKRIGRRSYYVRSEKIPMQTTLFGVLRYLGIREVKNNYDIEFLGATAVITSSSTKYIYVPNQWFVIASYAVAVFEEYSSFHLFI